MGVWLGPMGSAKFSAKSYTFTGTSSFFSSGDNWEIVLKSSGNLKFKKLPGEIDIFVVGCGAAGKAGSHDLINNQDDKALGGDGGDGGECVTRLLYKDIDLTTSNTYIVKLDIMETKTSIFTIEAANGGGEKTHGSGAIAYIGNPGAARVDATAPKNGSLAFGRTGIAVEDRTLYEADLNETIYFGAGGGAGSAVSNTLGGATASSSNGGTTGGGDGGSGATGGDARPNTGSGGGGGAAIRYGTYNGGAGGTGIIIIRNHRA